MAEAAGASDLHLFRFLDYPAVYTATVVIAELVGITLVVWSVIRRGGSISFKTPILFAVGFIFQLTLGVTGVVLANAARDVALHSTYYVVVHFHYVLSLGAVFLIFAGFYAWFDRISGRQFPEWAGQLHFWTTFIGVNLTFVPMHFLGLVGMPRRYVDYPPAFDGWNMVASYGSYIADGSTLFFVAMLLYVLMTGRKVADEP